jgi:hypothetical protein
VRGKAWLAVHDARMRELHALGCTDGIIARETGHSIDTVGDRRRAAGLAAIGDRRHRAGHKPDHPALRVPWGLPVVLRLTS